MDQIRGNRLANALYDNYEKMSEERGEVFATVQNSYALDKYLTGKGSVSVNINTERTNVVMGKEIYTLWGNPVISDTIHVRDMQRAGYPFTGKELTFHISPLSFYQINPVQTEKLYSVALEYAQLTGEETVWDLYCGIGTISLFLAANAKKVYGVEVIPQAIEDARENARKNNIQNPEELKAYEKDLLRFHVDSNKITAAMGVDRMPKPIIKFARFLNNSYKSLMLFSDGVTDCLSDAQLMAITKSTSPKDLAKAIVDKALTTESKLEDSKLGEWYNDYDLVIPAGKDNTTAAVYHNTDEGER